MLRRREMKDTTLILLSSILLLGGCSGETVKEHSQGENPNKVISSQESSAQENSDKKELNQKSSEQESSDTEKLNSDQVPSEPEDLVKLRSDVKEQKCYAAVSYLGYLEDASTQNIRNVIEASKTAAEYPFIQEITDEDMVDAAGCDIYCIVPANPDASVKIQKLDYDESGLPIKKDVIYQATGKQVILVCNVSDIMRNALVVIQDADGEHEFSPFLSLMDGSLAFETKDTNLLSFGEDIIVQ